MISVVIPLYNKERSIAATIRTVFSQTYTDWELIIVDDGSTDSSLKVVKELINKSHISNLRYQILTQPNGGVSSARNRGIIEANGDYIAFMDADDVWEPDYLETLAKLIKDYPAAVLYGLGYGWVKEEKRISRTGLDYRGLVPHDGSWLMRFWTSSCCVTKLAAQEVGLFNVRLTHGEDLDMWWRLMLHGDAVFDNTREYAYYVQDSENRAMAKMPPIDKHIVSIIDQYADARRNNAAFRKAFDTQMVYFLYQYMFTPYKKEARSLSKKLDYSQLKFSLRLRIMCPNIYRLITRR